MSDDRIEIVQARRDRQGGAAASGRPASSTSRRDRVARSRKQAADEQPTVDEVQDAHDDADTTDLPVAETPAEVAALAGEWPGSVEATDDGEMPEGFEIKGNASSMLYHEPDSRYYKATKAEVWFDSVESAEAAGFSKPGADKEEAADADDAADAADATEESAADEAEEK
jgi:hypothetical protein